MNTSGYFKSVPPLDPVRNNNNNDFGYNKRNQHPDLIQRQMLSIISDVKVNTVDNRGFKIRQFLPNIITASSKPFSKLLHDACLPFKFSLVVTGRFPFAYKKNDDETYSYRYALLTPQGLLFLSSSVLVLMALLFSVIGFIMLAVEDTRGSESARKDLGTLGETIISFLLVGNCMFNAVVGNIHILKNGGKQLASYLGHWSKSVNEMKMDVTIAPLQKYMLSQISVCHGFMFIFITLFLYGARPIIHEGTEDIALLMFRPFIDHPNHHSNFWMMKNVCFTVVVIAIYAYMGNILLVVFASQILRNGFRIWNGRFQYLVDPEVCKLDSDKLRNTTLELYEDHSKLLQLLEEANDFFAPITQTYYGSQILNICLEVFFLVTYGGDDPRDIAIGLTIMTQTCLVFYMVSIAASVMHEEAHAGFDILRNYGVLNARNENERIFLRSMAASYSGPLIALTGGKYFNIDRPFILTVLASVLTYFIIFLQFKSAK